MVAQQRRRCGAVQVRPCRVETRRGQLERAAAWAAVQRERRSDMHRPWRLAAAAVAEESNLLSTPTRRCLESSHPGRPRVLASCSASWTIAGERRPDSVAHLLYDILTILAILAILAFLPYLPHFPLAVRTRPLPLPRAGAMDMDGGAGSDGTRGAPVGGGATSGGAGDAATAERASRQNPALHAHATYPKVTYILMCLPRVLHLPRR